jgi:hypothetical protein
MFKAIMAAGVIVAISAIPAYADGCNPRLQDCDVSYKDETPARARNYVYNYTTRSTRGRWECPPEFNRRECRRIQAEIEQRRAREVRRVAPRVVYLDQRGRYLDERDRPKPGFGGKRCGGYFKVEGPARPILRYARGAAIKAWRHRVRTEGPGERYVDESYSPNFAVGKCRIIGDRGVFQRCTAEGTACQP